MKGYPRKTCKKAKAASLSLLCDGEEGLAVLCEGVGGETCYPVTHRLRRTGRGHCGEPQVGDTGDITIVSSSARRALQASLIFGTPRRSPTPSVFGKHGVPSSGAYGPAGSEQGLLQHRVPHQEGDEPDEPAPRGDKKGDAEAEQGPLGHGIKGPRGPEGPAAPSTALARRKNSSVAFCERLRDLCCTGARHRGDVRPQGSAETTAL